MQHYQEQEFENALQLFKAILEIDPRDHPSAYFQENALKYLKHGVPENWAGVESMISK